MAAETPTIGESFAAYMRRPEMVAERAERDRLRAERAAAAVAEHGSEEAVFADTPIEVALRAACAPLLGPGQTWDGAYELAEWSWLQGRDRMPAALRVAAARAWPMPETVAAAWAEHQDRDRREGDRCALFPDWMPHAFSEARRCLIEEVLDTCPARSLVDLRARLSWLDELNEIDATSQREQRVRLATLRADVERMGQRIREQDAEATDPLGEDQCSIVGSASVVRIGLPERGVRPAPHSSARSGTSVGNSAERPAPVEAVPDDRAYTFAEAAQMTGLSRSTIYALVAEGRLAASKVGPRRIIRRSVLEAFLDSLPVMESNAKRPVR